MHRLPRPFQLLHGKGRPIVTTCIYGLVASFVSVGFQFAISRLYKLCYLGPSQGNFWHFAAISFLVIVAGSLLVGWLLHSFCPEAAGSGIPQAKLAFWKEFGYSPRRIAMVKFLAGVVSIGTGQSLGREGPSVQLGSNLGSTVAGLLGVSKQNRRAANAAGSAAGLAAAFNAPLASVAFVLEEIIGDLNSRFIGGVLLASIIGAVVVHALIGAQPAFELARIGEPTWRAYLLMPVAAAFAALVGIGFQRATLGLRAKAARSWTGPRWLLPLGGGLATWGIGIAVFAATGRLGVFSLGYEDLSDALTGGIAWRLAALLLAGKLLVTIVAYGFGGCGGIFSPNLFFGAMCGACVAGLGGPFLHFTHSDQVMLMVGGMSACLGAVVQAPVTAILIIFEMTHQFSLLPGLMIAGLVSQTLARSVNRINFYEEVLEQDGHQIEHLIPPRDLRSWQNLPISAIAQFTPVTIGDPADEGALRATLAQHPYRYFPVVVNSELRGIAARSELEAALAERRPTRLEPPVTCRPGEIIKEIQSRFIEANSGFIVLTDKPDGSVLGIVTLHDILRAEVTMSEREHGA